MISHRRSYLHWTKISPTVCNWEAISETRHRAGTPHRSSLQRYHRKFRVNLKMKTSYENKRPQPAKVCRHRLTTTARETTNKPSNSFAVLQVVSLLDLDVQKIAIGGRQKCLEKGGPRRAKVQVTLLKPGVLSWRLLTDCCLGFVAWICEKKQLIH